ncbi:hypothetical protein [Streptomyces yerevanensis]|uniref:hypothetical protein n=1 Tax=Streptomyces yerevanensis TaxID=66378 RepID=UPI000526CA8C|nr:hypothetical protein [Streptomyces yerevanensis]
MQQLTEEDVEALIDWMITSARRIGGTPGTGRSVRTVELTLGRLRAVLDLTAGTIRVRRRSLSSRARPTRTSGRVVVDELGRVVKTDWFRRRAYERMRSAGVRRVRLYDALNLHGPDEEPEGEESSD